MVSQPQIMEASLQLGAYKGLSILYAPVATQSHVPCTTHSLMKAMSTLQLNSIIILYLLLTDNTFIIILIGWQVHWVKVGLLWW